VVEPDAAGHLVVNWTVRRPLVLAFLRQPLNTDAISLTVTLDRDGASVGLPSLRFAGYSEAGAALPLYSPDMAAGATTIPGLAFTIGAERQPETGGAVAMPPAEWNKLIGFKVIEGNVGKLLFVMLQEKARLRRQAREVCAMRFLGRARRDALDRIGASLGVMRFQDDLAYDASKNEVISATLKDASGKPALESDVEYARRLALYEPFLLTSRSRLLEILNGPGDPGDPNSGLISGLGLTERFSASEQEDPFALAFRIVGLGGPGPRNNFLEYLANEILIWLPDTAVANTAHNARYLPKSERDRIANLRQRLRDAYDFPANAACAPRLADALDRLGRVLKALGFNKKLTIARAQDAVAGSRYELGLGLDLLALAAADLDDLVARVLDTHRAPTADAEAELLIASARTAPPVAAAKDPDGAWLLNTCGIATIHRLSANTLYLSHLPVRGLVIDGPVQAALGASTEFSAHFYPVEDPAINAALDAGIATAAAAWTAAGEPAWKQLTPVEQAAAWTAAHSQTANAAPLEVFAAAGLPAITNPAAVVAELQKLPADMVATLMLDAALSSTIIAGTPAAIGALEMLVSSLRAAGISSALPFVTTANQVVVVVSVLGIPQVGVNLGNRRTSGFRWYVVPLGGQASAKALGGVTQLQASQTGAVALVCLGYVRQPGLADPYEVKIGLPASTLLSLKEYEFLMNTLELIYPIGVGIDTYAIRQEHVDLNGDGKAEPLKPSVFRTYRSFRKRRLRGIYQNQSS
jgi:hypothetical protein